MGLYPLIETEQLFGRYESPPHTQEANFSATVNTVELGSI